MENVNNFFSFHLFNHCRKMNVVDIFTMLLNISITCYNIPRINQIYLRFKTKGDHKAQKVKTGFAHFAVM